MIEPGHLPLRGVRHLPYGLHLQGDHLLLVLPSYLELESHFLPRAFQLGDL